MQQHHHLSTTSTWDSDSHRCVHHTKRTAMQAYQGCRAPGKPLQHLLPCLSCARTKMNACSRTPPGLQEAEHHAGRNGHGDVCHARAQVLRSAVGSWLWAVLGQDEDGISVQRLQGTKKGSWDGGMAHQTEACRA